MIARTDALDALRSEERERLLGALFITDIASTTAAAAAGLTAVRADKMAPLPAAVMSAAERGMPVVLALPEPDAALAKYLHDEVPDAELLHLRLPPICSTLAGLLHLGADDADLQREVLGDWLVGRDELGPHTWLASESEPRHCAEEHEPFPVHVLPPSLRAMVTSGANAQGVDVAFWAVPLLPTLAGCVGATRIVRVKVGWHEPAVVWAGLIAPSGTGKSPGLRELMRPVREHDYRLHERVVASTQEYNRAADEWKALPAGERGEKPQPPKMLAALLDDCTLEAVIARLADNPRGLLLAQDEIGGWLRSFNKYRSGGDEQSWLSIYGAEAVKCDRKGGTKRLYVKRAAVSVVGTVQSGIARRYLAGAEQRESGLAARLLIAAPPVVPAKWTDAVIPQNIVSDYSRVIAGLLDLELDEEGEPIPLPLTADARDMFVAFHDANGVATYQAHRAGDGDLAASLSKLRGAAVRIALVLSLAEAAESGVASLRREIDAQAMDAGITIAKWFESNARNIYREWDAAEAADGSFEHRDRRTDDAIDDRVHAELLTGPKTREELRTAFGRNIAARRIGAALERLRIRGAADCEKQPPGSRGGRPREVWFLTARGVSA